MPIYRKLVLQLDQPRTKAELMDILGISLPQLNGAFKELAKRNLPYQIMGRGQHVHYYITASEVVKSKLRDKYLYEQILDLIDTDEWWEMDEICVLLEVDSKAVGNAIRYMKRRGIARVLTKLLHTRYFYKVVHSDEEDTTCPDIT